MTFLVAAWRLVSTRDGREYLFTDLPTEPYRTHHVWTERLNRLRCRIQGHPLGEVFYNVGGLEPDHTCRGCGEDIG